MHSNVEPIAIVSMACRFPKIDTVDELWQAVCDRVNTADRVPPDRWDADRYYSANEVSKGKAYVRRGGFVNQDIKTFDASFFGISPREAENMDPQQRLILEVVWEAFENGGIVLPDLAGRNVGVYVGGFMLDHMVNQMSVANRSQINQHSAAGMMMTMLSNRISHTFDFRGPSLSIDTACSSSLVAFHYACQDVWQGACEMAIVGGTNVMMRPEYPMGMCKGRFLSRDGESKSFDARGDGYGRGEGAGVLLLKPLSRAWADGDTVLSTVIGSGTNQDGHTAGISMPSGTAQQSLIDEVCRRYGIDPSTVDYVECHGTGTAIGDPTECHALGATYGAARDPDHPVVIGSVKSNIGHLEAAAGVAGVIKAVLSVMHRCSPPLGNLQQRNPKIPFTDLGLRLSDRMIPLGRVGEPIRVAVNSFGYGGSNAHVLLQSPPITPDPCERPTPGRLVAGRSNDNGHIRHVMPVSGRSESALRANAERLADHVESSFATLDDLCYSATQRRAHLSHRAVAMGRSRHDVVAGLRAIAQQQESPRTVQDSQPFQGRRDPVFVFTGMGPQWWAMGQQLYRTQSVYRETVRRADAIFQEIAGFSILKEMLKNEQESKIQTTQFAQPGNLLIQIGIEAILNRLGVRPGAVVGHSVGELGAAHAAGVLGLEDALTICFHRSQLQAEMAGTGGMLAVALSHDEASARIADVSDQLSVAAVNGPSTITLAGHQPTLDRLADQLMLEGIFHRQLAVEVPYHSPMMDPLMSRLAQALTQVNPQPPNLPLYSTVTGKRVTDPRPGVDDFGAQYWPLNIRQPVLFEPAVRTLLDDGYTTFVEIGPHPVLASALGDCIQASGKECRLIQTLRKDQPNETRMLQRSAFQVFVAGCDIDWGVHTHSSNFVPLPNYAWQRERHWSENERAEQDRVNPIVYPMLGTQDALAAPVWRVDFDHHVVSYVRDHVVGEMQILPAASYLEALLELASIQFPTSAGLVVRSVDIRKPMGLPVDRAIDLTTTYDSDRRRASIRSLENGRLGTGMVHLTANLAGVEEPSRRSYPLDALKSEMTGGPEIHEFYRDLNDIGLRYGPMFQTVRELWVDGDQDRVLARVEIDESLIDNLAQYRLHPTTLDGCFQTLIALIGSTDRLYLPNRIDELCLYASTAPRSMWCLGEITARTNDSVTSDLTLLTDEGQVIGVVRGLRASVAGGSERTDRYGDVVKRQILSYQWSQGGSPAEPKRLGHWLVIGDAGEISEFVIHRMESYGARVTKHVRFDDLEAIDAKGGPTARPGNLDDARAVVSECGKLDGVAFFLTLDETLNQGCPTGEKSLNALLAFTQALTELPVESRPRVYVVTHAAFAVDSSDGTVHPPSSTINGFVRVAANELEGFRFTTVDLPSDPSDELTYESLTAELLCDLDHDEVAIREDARLVSELLESNLLTDDVVVPMELTDDHPIALRPLRDDCESIGTLRVIARPAIDAEENQVLIRVESSLLPADLIENQSSLSIKQPLIEIVGEVVNVGRGVTDLAVGTRVCGYAPADLVSHLVADRTSIFVTPIDRDVDAASLVGGITTHVRAAVGIDAHPLQPGDRALVVASKIGSVIATELKQRGIQVTILRDDLEHEGEHETKLCAEDTFPTYAFDRESLEHAVHEQTQGQRFNLLVCSIEQWTEQFDFRVLTNGGGVVDTDLNAVEVILPPHVASISRTSFEALTLRQRNLESAIAAAVDRISNGDSKATSPLEVSVADLAWQLLPITRTESGLAISYDTHGNDLPVVQRDDLRFRDDATYLVTGGFGGFGSKTALWLAAHGAKSIVLTGRRGADTPERKSLVGQLTDWGVQVTAAACDTANFEEVQSLLDDITRSLPPLKGVFHSAAIVRDQAVADAESETVSQVMRSKATGAWNLHLLTADLLLDHFVMYSSLATLIGNSRQSAYCAANGFLDGLANMRRSHGLPATSINWGAISDVGMVANDQKLEKFLRHLGLRGMSSSESLELMGIGLARDLVQFGVALITSWSDWASFETIGSKSPRFATLVGADSEQKNNSLRDELIAELEQLTPTDQLDLMVALITEMVASVLRAETENVLVDRPISELGVDSLMAAEIQVLFESKLGLGVSVLELIGDITIRSLALNVIERIHREMNSKPTAPSRREPVESNP